MPITNTYLQSLEPQPTPQTKGCGYGLKLKIKATYTGKNGELRGGGKYFIGRYQGEDINVGTFGKNAGEYSLDEALTKWMDIKKWCLKNGGNISDYKTHLLIGKQMEKTKTLYDAIQGFLKDATDIKATTHKEYTYKLNNQILSHLEGSTPLRKLEWDKGGREIIEQVISKIEDGKKFDLSHRCRQLLCQVFDYSIDKGWMRRGQNPSKQSGKNRKRHEVKHHPSITWNEVPLLLSAINTNACNAHNQTVLATKLMLMTFLRTGALARLKWEWIDEKEKMLTISGCTSGLKRTKGVNENIPHHIPITPEMEKLFERASQLSGGKEYVFLPLKENTKHPFIAPSAPNNFFRSLGYKGKQRAHAWRSVARTVGVEVLKTPENIIKRQMGHLPSDKLDKAYDKSLLLDERREFLNKWCSLLVETGLEI